MQTTTSSQSSYPNPDLDTCRQPAMNYIPTNSGVDRSSRFPIKAWRSIQTVPDATEHHVYGHGYPKQSPTFASLCDQADERFFFKVRYNTLQ